MRSGSTESIRADRTPGTVHEATPDAQPGACHLDLGGASSWALETQRAGADLSANAPLQGLAFVLAKAWGQRRKIPKRLRSLHAYWVARRQADPPGTSPPRRGFSQSQLTAPRSHCDLDQPAAATNLGLRRSSGSSGTRRAPPARGRSPRSAEIWQSSASCTGTPATSPPLVYQRHGKRGRDGPSHHQTGTATSRMLPQRAGTRQTTCPPWGHRSRLARSTPAPDTKAVASPARSDPFLSDPPACRPGTGCPEFVLW
mmetsp:Transcript_6975/g.16459  ORF Transcript_6975/g.16459 Transcript_6975/m.16459 type:complete len:257 (-) Transcript_6975:910-1680(-)